MQKLISFIAELDEFDKYKFTKTIFPNHYAPDDFVQSGKGTFSHQHSIIDGQTVYILYGLGRFNGDQLSKLKEDWQRFHV
ncbi:hypothetical protein BEN74_04055 [Acinetobacter sp. WCHAc010034]|uniref:hypothetical protein n=1 Tax=Acinetobacter sp. WCHAc010034 TaxID=1879049 RepID=UPI00083A68E9|nr:hypothetical protein [Acinetobacter sp. WCHAc010034]AYA02123.1 hypothetical protein BEN74_04055 [Acinetobacter sp. WCHAc010034]